MRETVATLREQYQRKFDGLDKLPELGPFRSYELIKAAIFKMLGDLEGQAGQVQCAK